MRNDEDNDVCCTFTA